MVASQRFFLLVCVFVSFAFTECFFVAVSKKVCRDSERTFVASV